MSIIKAIAVVFLLSFSLNAQQDNFNGIVLDYVSKKPIQFATVSLKNSDYGVYTGERGEFVLSNVKSTNSDSIKISCIGYESKAIALKEVLPGTAIQLSPKEIDLEEAIVKASSINRYRAKRIGVDRKKTHNSFSSRVHTTYEFAVFIPNTKKYNGFFESIEIYITQFDTNNDPFRLNIYSVDSVCGCPGKSLLKSSQYISRAKKGWNSISIENQYIEIPQDGFYISYERLPLNSMSNLNPQHHSIGWIKDIEYAKHQTYTRSGDNDWSIENRFTRKGYIPLVRSITKIY